MNCGKVAIVGRPNSGKSTLINALVGQKVSIVSDKPQTTRHRIAGAHSDARGQIVFCDTPGIHRPLYRMNARMLDAVRETLSGVDLVLLLVDGSAPFGSGERFVLEMVKGLRPASFLLINKIDRIAKPRLLPIIERYSRAHAFREIVPISALRRENLDLLVDLIFRELPERGALFEDGFLTDRSERFYAAEYVREKILARTRDELPYATAVRVRRFDESRRGSAGIVSIDAEVIVDKVSQQGIIVGAGGRMLRDIGAAARKDLEALLGCRVYLSLQVVTMRGWRDRENILDDLELK